MTGFWTAPYKTRALMDFGVDPKKRTSVGIRGLFNLVMSNGCAIGIYAK